MLDISEDFLRGRFANVQITVTGERTLMQKLLPVIELRERKLDRDFLPMSMFKDDGLEDLCMGVVAYGALYDGFPMLDVVLTPNGLATVGNNNLVPASSARSEAARSALAGLLFQQQEALLEALRKKEEWLNSKWSNIFGRSLIVPLSDLCALNPDRASDSFELARVMQLKAAIEEDRIAERYISQKLMEHLRSANLAFSLSPEEQHVVERIKDAVHLKIVSKGMAGEILIDVVEYIRLRPDAFPLWHASRVAKTFQDHRFKNDRSSGGFFF